MFQNRMHAAAAVAAASGAALTLAPLPAAHAAVTVANYEACESSEPISYGDFYATVTYSYSGGTSASLTVQLDNTTPLALGGYITGLALNGGPGVTGMSFVSCTDADFGGLSYPVEAPPWPDFMVGASIGSKWQSGGQPSKGIAAGSSATFAFTMVGTAAALGALDAETALAAGCGAMAVRFRGGAVTDWSDKVLGQALPAPGAIAVVGLAALGRRRRRA